MKKSKLVDCPLCLMNNEEIIEKVTIKERDRIMRKFSLDMKGNYKEVNEDEEAYFRK